MAQPIAPGAARRVTVGGHLRRVLGREYAIGIPFVLPAVLLCVGLIAYPVGYATYLSFTSKIAGRPEQFVGLDNYASLWQDRLYRQAVWTTTYYTFLSVSAKFLVGLGLALLLNQRIPGRNVLTGIILLPWVAPPVVTALVWRWLYQPVFGVFSYITIHVLHLRDDAPPWLSDPGAAMYSVILTTIWRGFPFFAVMLLSGLKGINQELYESASIDGANVVARFWHVTRPGLRNVAIVVTLLSVIQTFNDFTIVWNLTRGGPLGATRLYSILTYEVAFGSLQLGKGVAISLTMAPLLAIIVVVLARYMRRA